MMSSAIFLVFVFCFSIYCSDLYVNSNIGEDFFFNNGTINNCEDENKPCQTILHIEEDLCHTLTTTIPNIVHFVEGVEIIRNISYIECIYISEIRGPPAPGIRPTILFMNQTYLDLEGKLERVRITGTLSSLSINELADCVVEDVTLINPSRAIRISDTVFQNIRPGVDEEIVALFSQEVYFSKFKNFEYGIIFGESISTVENTEFWDNNKVFYKIADSTEKCEVSHCKFYNNQIILEEKNKFLTGNHFSNCEFVNNTQFGKMDGGTLKIVDSEITYNYEKQDYYLRIYEGNIILENTPVTMNEGNMTEEASRGIYIRNKKGGSSVDISLKNVNFKGDNFIGIYSSKSEGKARIGMDVVGLGGKKMIGVKINGEANEVEMNNVHLLGDDCGCVQPFECLKDGTITISKNCKLGEKIDYESLKCQAQVCSYNGSIFDDIDCPIPPPDDNPKKKKNENNTFKNLGTVSIVIILFSCAACCLLVLLVIGIIIGILRCWYVRKNKGVRYNELDEEELSDDGDEIEMEDIEGDTDEESDGNDDNNVQINDMELLADEQ